MSHARLQCAVLAVLCALSGCGGTEGNDNDESRAGRDYRDDMRAFVKGISAYARGFNSRFVVIPQNGQELLTRTGEASGTPAEDYIQAIDGVSREDLFYGYAADDAATPAADREYMIGFLDLARAKGLTVLVIDYCSTRARMNDSYESNARRGYVSFAADHRNLDDIPGYPATPYRMSGSNVSSLKDAKNFLYLINPGEYATKTEFLTALRATSYDVVIVDLFFDEDALTSSEVAALKTKAGGGARLVIAYMSIGEAEDYRYYWQPAWALSPPAWLDAVNPDWPGNHKVKYWMPDWQRIIYGDNASYLKRILDAGFDGVYLDIIDAFEYFE